MGGQARAVWQRQMMDKRKVARMIENRTVGDEQNNCIGKNMDMLHFSMFT